MTVSIVIASGGTGGHLIPALAIADAIRSRDRDARITFVGTRRALDASLVTKAGYEMAATGMKPFGGGMRGVLGVASTVPATAQAARILHRARADSVVGMGGYATLPVVIAARMRGVPSVIHEGNVVAGLANEVAARFTRNIAVSFEATLARFPDARVTGMLLRPSFASFDRERLREQAFAHLRLDPARKTIVMFGGSLGAVRLNAAVPGLARRWRDRSDLQLLVVAGRDHADLVRAQLSPGAVDVLVEQFVDRMDLAFAAADVVISRAGGSTVAEVAVAGVPSILIPFPHARRREQHANAAVLVRAGGALSVDDASADADLLGGMVDDLLADDERRAAMGKAARSLARPDAASAVGSWALQLAEGRR